MATKQDNLIISKFAHLESRDHSLTRIRCSECAKILMELHGPEGAPPEVTMELLEHECQEGDGIGVGVVPRGC